MMATQDDVAVVRDDIAEVKREVLLVRRDQQAHEERVEARFTLMEERMEARSELTDERMEAGFAVVEERMEAGFALVEERMKAWAHELRAHFETEIRRASTVQTLIQTATMVALVWAARG